MHIRRDEIETTETVVLAEKVSDKLYLLMMITEILLAFAMSMGKRLH